MDVLDTEIIYDEYYEIKELLSDIENWKWMREHHSKGKFNNDVKTINEWLLEESYPEYRLVNTYEKHLTLTYKGDGVCRWHINDHHYTCNMSIWNIHHKFLEVNDLVHHINRVLNTETAKAPEYDIIIKNLQCQLEEVIEDVIIDFYTDILEEGVWYTLKDKRELWYKGKGYDTDKVTFTDFSETGKTCRITAYKDGEVVFDSKRYSVLTFSTSNYWWLEGQLTAYCKKLDTKK